MTVQVVGDEPLVTVHTAAVEVGQGLVTLQEQIARTELGIAQVRVETADTRVGSAGSTSASQAELRHRRRGAGGVPRGRRRAAGPGVGRGRASHRAR